MYALWDQAHRALKQRCPRWRGRQGRSHLHDAQRPRRQHQPLIVQPTHEHVHPLQSRKPAWRTRGTAAGECQAPLTAAWNQRRKQRPAVLARQPARLPPGPVSLNPRSTQLTTFTAPRHPPDVRVVVHAPSANIQPTYLCRTPVKPQPLKEDRDRTLNKTSQPHLVLLPLFSQHPVSV